MTDVGSAPRIIIVSAVDSRFLPLLRGMMASIQSVLAAPHVDFACFDIGLTPSDRAWLLGQGARIQVPGAHFGLKEADYPAPLRSFLARPFLPSYFPGYDVYLWIDSDVWLQRADVIDAYVAGALQSGLAVTHESEPAYRFQPWLFGWTGKHFLKGYGVVTGGRLLMKTHLNAGFFAASHDAPHWAAWASRYAAAIGRTGKLVPHDQFALVQAVYKGAAPGSPGLKTAIMAPENNWICDRGVPMWNDDLGLFCKPYAPYSPIGALHLAGPAKKTAYDVRRTNGGSFKTFITFGASPQSPAVTGPLTIDPPCPPLALAALA